MPAANPFPAESPLRWDRPGVPRKGWSLFDVVDIGESECQMCGYHPLRFVHFLRHPDWRGELEVGCVCAEHLTGDYVNPRRMEREVRKRAKKKDRFIASPRWKVRPNGNHVYQHGGVAITVCPDQYRPGCYRYVLRGVWRGPFGTVERAKSDAFRRLHA
jgi:hypothetical protein